MTGRNLYGPRIKNWLCPGNFFAVKQIGFRDEFCFANQTVLLPRLSRRLQFLAYRTKVMFLLGDLSVRHVGALYFFCYEREILAGNHAKDQMPGAGDPWL